MTKTNEQHGGTADEPKDRLPSDFEALKSSFAQLRDDVTKLLHDALGAGRSEAGMLKDRASSALGDARDRASNALAGAKDRVGDLKDYGCESVERFGEKVSERPVLSAAIALGIGFALAKLLTTKR